MTATAAPRPATTPTAVTLGHRPARLDDDARVTALAFANALLPAGKILPAAGEATLRRLEAKLGGFGAGVLAGYGALLRTLSNATRPTHGGRRFHELTVDEATAVLRRMRDGGTARRTMLTALAAPMKTAHFDDPELYGHLGCTWRHDGAAEPARWRQQIVDGAELDAEVECDVVVVGTGAGGAVVAKELAERGLAVLMCEEGGYHDRDDFDGDTLGALQRFYRAAGSVVTVGNAVIPVMSGSLVGGSTTINEGTCFRTPDRVLAEWARHGLEDLAPEKMGGYFDRVEAVLQVTRATPAQVGGVGTVVARGADALGYSHRALDRNAPDCDGAGTCEFGCPTGAKRSTNVSYVPLALQRGAICATGTRVERVVIEGGRATGVIARARSNGAVLRVRARAVVLAAGTLMTPVLLQRQGLGLRLPHLGRHLSIHPASGLSAMFDEPVRGYLAAPQSYLVDEFHDDGFLCMGSSLPVDLAANAFEFVGDELVRVMEHFDRVAQFGFFVSDRSNGAVFPGVDGRPFITYRLGRRERELCRRAVLTVARIFLAAGASEVYPMVHGHRVLRNAADLDAFASARIAARDYVLTAYHPLGTARMATSARHGVVDAAQRVFGVDGLVIADGSVMPSCTEVNPQVSIMAFATRAADLLADRLESGTGG
jgi:hypothetical protein